MTGQSGNDQGYGAPGRLGQVAAWVVIVAGVVFVVTVIFFAGLVVGWSSGAHDGWHRGYYGGRDGTCPLMGSGRNDGTRRHDGTRRNGSRWTDGSSAIAYDDDTDHAAPLARSKWKADARPCCCEPMRIPHAEPCDPTTMNFNTPDHPHQVSPRATPGCPPRPAPNPLPPSKSRSPA